MDRKTSNTLLYIFFLLFGLGVTVWVFLGQDLNMLQEILAQTNWMYVGLSLLLTLGGHWLRAARWRQLVEAGEENGEKKSGVMAYMVALMNGYLVNLGVPRLGELTRCASLNRLNGAPVVRVGASVLVERLIDLACLALVLVLAFTLAGAELGQFFRGDIFAPLNEKFAGKAWLLVALGVVGLSVFVGIFLFIRLKTKNSLLKFLQKQARELKSGMFGFVAMRGKGLFVLYTILIWLSYFSAPFLTLFALGLNGSNALEVGFVAFAVGSIARTVPAPAGSMGPYHWLVMHALLLYGLSESEGLAVATLNHAVQTIFYLLAGGFSFVFWAWLSRKSL